MDATEEVAPIGVILQPLRDKQALAIPTTKPAYLERTPAPLPDLQTTRFHLGRESSPARAGSPGTSTQSYHGDVEILLRTIFRQVPQSQWKEAVQRFSNGPRVRRGDLQSSNL